MGFLTMEMGFLKYDRIIVYISAAVLAFYAFYFYFLGDKNGLLFLIWSAIAFFTNLMAKKKPLIAYGTLLVSSFILYYTLRYFVEGATQSPHSQILTTMLTVLVGVMIDSLYWVYKYDSGKKFKTNYDD